jgi:hypothetical protein
MLRLRDREVEALRQKVEELSIKIEILKLQITQNED